MGLSTSFERYCGTLDEVFGYHTPRTLLIKDRWLGISLLLIRIGILAYVVGFQVIVEQQYRALMTTESSVRFQLRAPTDAYRWPVAGVMAGAPAGAGAPYCTGVTDKGTHPLASSYTIDAAAGTYTYTGAGGAGVPLRQRTCAYLDAIAGAPFPETDRLFLSSDERVTAQTLRNTAAAPWSPTSPPCTNEASPACNWGPPEARENPAITNRSFVADVEMFTLLIDHNFVVLDAPWFSRTSREMRGFMRRADGVAVDACRPYNGFPAGCPVNISVGDAGKPDIVSIATILEAAGVNTLDNVSLAPGSGNSVREGGVVILLEVTYSNFYYGLSGTGSMSENEIIYTYSASLVPNTEFKIETAEAIEASPDGAAAREFLDRHGIRIMLNTEGHVGRCVVMGGGVPGGDVSA